MVVSAREERSARIAVTVFPLMLLSGGLVAMLFPSTFVGFGAFVTPGLMIIMFGMGLTLTPKDFAVVIKRPLPVLLGLIAQYTIMPLTAVAIAMLLQLPPVLAAGLILVGCAPGGTASNVVTYLARGDLALSVAMTSVSTLVAPIMMPLLTLWLAGTLVEVNAGSMAWSIVQIVLIPVIAGLLLRTFLPGIVTRILPAMPWISVVAITFVLIAVVSASAAAIVAAGWIVLLAVFLHNGAGLALGYASAKLFRLPVSVRRTMSIEIGMQNSALAAGLARNFMSPEAALPAAVSAVWHTTSGALLAAFWRRRGVPQ